METPVIDFHGHVGRWSTAASDDDPGLYLRMMDAAGVDKACINCIFHSDARRANELVADYVARHPDRFIGVAFVTPHYPEEAVAELERAFGSLDLKYLKIYPTYLGRPIDDPGYFPIYEWCNDRDIVIMCHSSNTGPDDTLTRPLSFIPLAQRYTRIRWVLAHSGNTPQGNLESIEAAQACTNVYLETCSSYTVSGTVELLVEGAGEDKVLFGVDMPLLDPRNQLGKIVTSDISDQAKRKVLGLNAIELLGLSM